MHGKSVSAALAGSVLLVSICSAQEKVAPEVRAELDALKAQIKAQDERIDKLAQEVSRLVEGGKPKAAPTASTPVARALPATTPPTTAGVDSPAPADPANTRTHTVLRGETLTQIAKQYGVTVEEIQQLNKIEDAKKLQAGQTIKIPPPGASPSTANPKE